MKEIDILDFKKRCGRWLKQVQKTGEPIRVIRDGKPVAEILPASRGQTDRDDPNDPRSNS
jgi:antitoxin (DNA-binding transcriptional repressor) of toxin-antitoxin stability system